MRRRTFARLCTWTVAALVTAAGQAQTRDTPRLSWGDPDLEGTWTNATLTQLQRPPELGTKTHFTPEEAAAFARQRLEQTNADRPARPGEVGAYNDAFFERICGGVRPNITDLAGLLRLVGLEQERAFALTGNSTSLVAKSVSAINPRIIVFPRIAPTLEQTEDFVAVSFVRGEPFAEITSRDTVASNGRIHEEMLALLRR